MLSRKRNRGTPPVPLLSSEMDTSDSLLHPVLTDVAFTQSAVSSSSIGSISSISSKSLKRVRKNTQPGELRLLRDLEDLAADEIAGRVRLKFAAPTAIEATIFLDATSIVSVLVLIDRYYPHKAPQVHCLAFGAPGHDALLFNQSGGGGGGIQAMQGTSTVKALANSFPRPEGVSVSIHSVVGGGGQGEGGELELVGENEGKERSSSLYVVKPIDKDEVLRMIIPQNLKMNESSPTFITGGKKGEEGEDDEVMDGLLAAFSGAFSSETEIMTAETEIMTTDKQHQQLGYGPLSSSSSSSSMALGGKEVIDDENDPEDENEKEEEEELKMIVIEVGKRIELPLLSSRSWSPVFTLKQVLEAVANEARLRL